MMQTRTITNAAIRSYKIPVRTGPDGETFGTRISLKPGQVLTVPEWYFAALLEERGWARRMDATTGVVRGPRSGVAAVFEARIRQQRQAKLAAAAQERARAAEGQVDALEARLRALESDREQRAREVAEATERAKAAEARAAELEQRVADGAKRSATKNEK